MNDSIQNEKRIEKDWKLNLISKREETGAGKERIDL